MAYHSNGYAGAERLHESSDRNVNKSNKPVYLMEHLATFTVTQETGIVYPADGMRRLLQLEKTNGIWSQKMQLCLDHPWVLIMDFETGTVMERFPLALIQEPTAFTSNDPMDLYNNILVFIVGSSGNGHNPYPEMHIFQCQSVSAEDLVEELKMHKNGKTSSEIKRSNIPPLPAQNHPPPKERDLSVINPYRESDLEGTGINDETSSTTSEKYERDVAILNHCFDDIEKFIARLQHAAAASRELERRRRNRKSKKKDLGDGMLTMRTKPPPEKEFVDIFQKFKLSFNLLAKLKAHIHDPNAPELIHFLFTPLALIVDASHETFYEPNLPSKVISPLLTREAVNLLINCVTSKETELWHSLGNAWLIPRDQWKGHVPPYYPVFMDGWSPEYLVTDEMDPALDVKLGRDPHDDAHYNNDFLEYEPPTPELNRLMLEKRNSQSPRHDMREPKMELPGPTREGREYRDVGARSDISVDSIERSGYDQDNWLAELQARDAHIVQVTYPRTANNDKELTVSRGEFLEVLDDQRKWWKARNSRGQVAHVPHTIVAPYQYEPVTSGNEANDVFNNPLYTQNYSQGDIPSGTFSSTQSPSRQDHPNSNSAQTDWLIKERLGNNSVPLPPPMPSRDMLMDEPISRQDDYFDRNSLYSEIQKHPLNRQKSLRSNYSYDSRMDQSISVNEELKTVFPRFKRNQNIGIPIPKTPQVFIDENSTVTEVDNWLEKKGFSKNIREKMKDLNGREILSCDRHKLEEEFGREGKRLASQLTLQKEICKYTVNKNSELLSFLAIARKKADGKLKPKLDIKKDDDKNENTDKEDKTDEEKDTDDENDNEKEI